MPSHQCAWLHEHRMCHSQSSVLFQLAIMTLGYNVILDTTSARVQGQRAQVNERTNQAGYNDGHYSITSYRLDVMSRWDLHICQKPIRYVGIWWNTLRVSGGQTRRWVTWGWGGHGRVCVTMRNLQRFGRFGGLAGCKVQRSDNDGISYNVNRL
jgi:hypothetical protein